MNEIPEEMPTESHAASELTRLRPQSDSDFANNSATTSTLNDGSSL